MSTEPRYEDKLVYMANQIAKNFAVRGTDAAALATVDHIKKFWDPRMRSRILAHLEAGGAGLDEVSRLALAKLREG